MKYHGVVIYDENEGEFVYAKPMLYNGTEWKLVDAYVYSSGWQLIGAAGGRMIPFLDANGKYVYVNGGTQPFMVLELLDQRKLIDSNSKYIKDSNGNQLYAEYGG